MYPHRQAWLSYTLLPNPSQFSLISHISYIIFCYTFIFSRKKNLVWRMLAQDEYIVSPHSLLSLYLRQKEQISYIYSIYVCSQAKKIMYGCYYLNFLGMAKKNLSIRKSLLFWPAKSAKHREFPYVHYLLVIYKHSRYLLNEFSYAKIFWLCL